MATGAAFLSMAACGATTLDPDLNDGATLVANPEADLNDGGTLVARPDGRAQSGELTGDEAGDGTPDEREADEREPDENPPIPEDSGDADALSCDCVPYDADASVHYPSPVTTSLECFLAAGSDLVFGTYGYDAYRQDPCVGLGGLSPGLYEGDRRVTTYSDCPFMIVSESGLDAPSYRWVFDTTTKKLVGAWRHSTWTFWDPIFCASHPSLYGSAPSIEVQAGVIPTCMTPIDELTCPPSDGSTPADHDSGADASMGD